jgi:hypothetical protein
MDNAERTYSKSEIRERRRKLEQTLALQQRQLAALAKMDEAADELDQVERELAELADEEPLTAGQPAPDLPSDDLSPYDPGTTGGRSEAILKSRPLTWLNVREVLSESAGRGWTSGDELARMSYRAALRRLAHNNDHIERDESGITHLYRWVPGQDDEQAALTLAPVMHANGSGYAQAAAQGGESDG